MPFPPVTDEVVRRYDVEAPRYTSYPTVPSWTAEFGPAEYAAALERAGDPLSLYVHLPFCRELCTFCGCNMVVLRDRSQIDEYLDAVEAELSLLAARLGRRRQLAQMHWGGGTPTSLDERQIERLFRAIVARFDVVPGAEVAVEIDPTVTRASQIELMRTLGFNRLSMGVQDFDPVVQETIHRIQTVEETRDLLERARSLGYRGLNVDLIYGLPHQNATTWKKTLETVLALRPDRAAVYSFGYLPQLRHHHRLLPVAALPVAAAKLALFGMAYDAFEGAGYRPIGMDHFARDDDELSIAQAAGRLRRNFQGYTASPVAEVVAVGATGISDVGGAYAQNVRALPYYQTAVTEGRFATDRGIVMTEDDLARRDLIQHVMCHFQADLDGPAARRFAEELARMRALEAEGLVRVRQAAGGGVHVEATPLGRIFVRNVAAVFDAGVRKKGSHSKAV